MKPVKKFPVLLIVSVVLCALGYVLRPLMPGLADMFRHLGFIWIGYGVFALLLKQPMLVICAARLSGTVQV